ncbi:hypothetical protein Bca4012_046576 [Brassica carinata]
METTRVKNIKHLLQTTAVRFKPELSIHRRRSTRQNSNCRGHVLLYGEPTTNLHRRGSLSTDSGKPPEVYQTDDEESLTQSDLPKYPSRTPDRRFKENSVIYNPPNIKQRCEKRDERDAETKPDSSVKVNASRQKQMPDILVKPTEIYRSH